MWVDFFSVERWWDNTGDRIKHLILVCAIRQEVIDKAVY